MPRTTAPSTNPRILAGYAPYGGPKVEQGAFSKIGGSASTTEERRQLLLSDPYACDVQAEQVTCTRCSKTVRLQKGKQYHLAHWLDHRWRCDRMETDPQPRARCRTLAERKGYLEADPDAKVVEPERVVCARCNKEVKLRKGRAYGLSCWTQHKLSCQQQQHQQQHHHQQQQRQQQQQLHGSSSSSSSSSIGASIGSASTIASASPSSSSSTSASGTSAASLSAPSPNSTLKSDPLVAAIDSNGVKCANCHKWVDIGQIHNLDWHAWRRHRDFCLLDNPMPIDHLRHSPPANPQFLRARASTIDTIASTSTSNASTPHPSDSSDDAEEPPRTLEPRPMDLPYPVHHHHLPHHAPPQMTSHHHHHHHHPQHHHHHHHQHGSHNYQGTASRTSSSAMDNISRSVSPLSPPPLSFSTVTSAATSVASSPMTSPSFRRKPSLFSNPRHLPLPECPPASQPSSSASQQQPPPPVLGLSRLTLGRDDEQRGDKYKPSLGLYFSSPPSRHPSPTLSSSGLGTSSSSSSSRHDPDCYLPPYPERTPIILPLPERYWRFGSIE